MEGVLAREISFLTQDEDAYCIHPQKWVGEMVGQSLEETLESPSGLELRQRVGPDFTLITACLNAALHLDEKDFRLGVENVYDAVIRTAKPRELVRVWNFIPGILDPLGDVDQRYKVFNSGRYNSYSRWYEGAGEFRRRIATASGIGTSRDDLIVHALATTGEAEPFENPRQVSSYCYSEKYGKLPPCFARATRVALKPGGPHRLLVGGTASICGETTYHNGNLEPQLEETLHNLAAVVDSGLGDGSGACCLIDSIRSSLANYRFLRVYCPHEDDQDFVAAKVSEAFERVESVEIVQSHLCRDDLRVEIEGWAELEPR